MADSAGYPDTPDLSFCAATEAHPEEFGHWGRSVVRCYTLRSALRQMCLLYPQQSSFLETGLFEGRTHAWLWRRRKLASQDPSAEMQGEQSSMGMMIGVVRIAAGNEWNLPAVRIESPKSEWALRSQGL